LSAVRLSIQGPVKAEEIVEVLQGNLAVAAVANCQLGPLRFSTLWSANATIVRLSGMLLAIARTLL
jgi:hypothetical protein